MEEYGSVHDAIQREKQIKGWLRKKKVALIESENPAWGDLAAEWWQDAQDLPLRPG
jgi:putative endonuclease